MKKGVVAGYPVLNVHVSVYDGVSSTNNSGIFYFIISYNPVLSTPGPSNNSLGQYIMPNCNVTVSDADGGTVTVRFYENTTGSWVLQQTNSSVEI
jgi:translation elongation factor EF-G